ncbi:unnamed protein product [Amoebophrya sp. A25]|nr:unnamed protein product [Amoebophrya sp. A25]|eukprot:GSA25T00009189001.1
MRCHSRVVCTAASIPAVPSPMMAVSTRRLRTPSNAAKMLTSSRVRYFTTGGASSSSSHQRHPLERPTKTSILYLTDDLAAAKFLRHVNRVDSLVGIDLEGSLGRFGRPNVMQVYSPVLHQAAILDLRTILAEESRGRGRSQAEDDDSSPDEDESEERPPTAEDVDEVELERSEDYTTTTSASTREDQEETQKTQVDDLETLPAVRELLENAEVQKVFHDCREDVSLLQELFHSSSSTSASSSSFDFDRAPSFDSGQALPLKLANVFDTQVAHLAWLERRGNEKYLASLSELLRIFVPFLYKARRWDLIEKLGARLHGSFTRGNWELWMDQNDTKDDQDDLEEDGGDGDDSTSASASSNDASSTSRSSSRTRSAVPTLTSTLWEHRPLSRQALQYAVEGCLVLPKLAAELRGALRDPSGAWVAERTKKRYLAYAELNRDKIFCEDPGRLVDRRGRRILDEEEDIFSSGIPARTSNEDSPRKKNKLRNRDDTVFVDGFVCNRTGEGATQFACNGLRAIAHEGFEEAKVGDTYCNLRVIGRNRRGLFVAECQGTERENLGRKSRAAWGAGS